MLFKGSYSFVAMMVINPIVIVLYQNWSELPIMNQAKVKPAAVVERQVASQGNALKVTISAKQNCLQINDDKNKKKDCIKNQ